MKTTDDLDLRSDELGLRLSAWMDATAPTREPAGLVAGAVGRTGSVRQRPAFLVRTGLREGRFAVPDLSPRVKLLILAALLLVAVGAAAAVGARLLAPPAPIDRSRNTQLIAQGGAIFYSVMDIPSRPYNHLHVVNADGTGDHEVAQGGCPIFSTDGSRMSYWSGWAETRQLVIANADGSSPGVVSWIKATDRRVSPIIVGISTAALSPDFAQVAWLKSSLKPSPNPNEVWVTPVSGPPGVLVAPKSKIANEEYTDLIWSPDGRRLAIVGMSPAVDPNGSDSGSYRSSIYVVDADGSNLRRVSARPGWDSAQVSWSPDGRYLAFDGTPDGSPLPSLPMGSLYPPLDVFVIGADGTGERNLTNTTSETERDPLWSPDGSRLAYSGPFEGDVPPGSPIMIVRIADGAPVGQAVRGPDTAHFQWSPDGEQLLMIDSQETTSNGATLEQDLPASGQPQTFDSQIRLIDAEFGAAPVTVRTVPNLIASCVGWQPQQPQQ
jgi:hypothetical protein